MLGIASFGSFRKWSQLPYNPGLLCFVHEVLQLIHIALKGTNELDNPLRSQLLFFFFEIEVVCAVIAHHANSIPHVPVSWEHDPTK